MQSTNSEYGLPYLAVCHVFFFLKGSIKPDFPLQMSLNMDDNQSIYTFL